MDLTNIIAQRNNEIQIKDESKQVTKKNIIAISSKDRDWKQNNTTFDYIIHDN